LCPSLRIRGHLVAAFVNGGGEFENGRISYFEGLVTLTLNQVILHTIVHHSLTFDWNQRNILWTDGRTNEHLRLALLGRLCWRVDLKTEGSDSGIRCCWQQM